MPKRNFNVGQLSLVRTKYKWLIDDFCTLCTEPGEQLISPTFSTNNGAEEVKWSICLYPRGRKDSRKDWVAVFLVSHSTTSFKVQSTITILNNNNVADARLDYESQIYLQDVGWGSDQFLTRQHLMDPSNAILKNGRLTLVCELVENANDEKEKSLRLKELDELEQLMDETNYSDVELRIEGKTIRAHKCILAKKSSVFADKFLTETKVKCEHAVDIPDMKYSVFVEMLRYVYSCRVTNIETMAVELLAAADRYSIDGLKVMCERTICSSLSVDNAVECLVLAERYHLDKLRRNTLDFVVKHATDIVDRPEFKRIGLDTTREILRAVVKKKRA